MASTSLFSRPLDLLFFVYFASHIPITFLLDCQQLYPPGFIPQPLKDLSNWYITTYRDPFMTPNDFYWFKSLVCCELLLQLPFFLYAVVGLYNGAWSKVFVRRLVAFY